MAKIDFVNPAKCYWYAVRNGKTLAEIAKYKNTATDTHPFKVSFKKGDEYKPIVAFWPDFQDYLASAEEHKKNPGYFEHRHGGFEEAKRFIEESFN